MTTFYDLPQPPPLEVGRQLLPTIHGLRRLHPASDRSILDLFHLLELGLVPGLVSTAYLRQLWRCSQPNVSRRIRALNGLGVFGVRSAYGGYVVSDRAAAAWVPAPRFQVQTHTGRRPQRVVQQWDAARALVASALEVA